MSISIKEIIDVNRKKIMNINGVIGIAVGISSKEPEQHCIIIYTSTNERPFSIPDEIDGFPVEVKNRNQGFRAY